MSERYDGLNLPQLQGLMHDIVVAEPVSWMPQTDAWWVLLAWLIAILGMSAIKYVQYRRRNRYRRDALAELGRIDTSSASAAAEVACVIKRTALVAYARRDVASLCGTTWAEFLVESAGDDALIRKSAATIASAPYRPGIDANDILKPAKRWIKVHRA